MAKRTSKEILDEFRIELKKFVDEGLTTEPKVLNYYTSTFTSKIVKAILGEEKSRQFERKNRYGFFSLEKEKNKSDYCLFWTNGKHYHSIHEHPSIPAMMFTFDQDLKLLFVFRSTITMWIQWSSHNPDDKLGDLEVALKYLKTMRYCLNDRIS